MEYERKRKENGDGCFRWRQKHEGWVGRWRKVGIKLELFVPNAQLRRVMCGRKGIVSLVE